MNKDDVRDTIIIGIGLWAIAAALDFIPLGPLDTIGIILSSIFKGFFHYN